MSDAFPVALYLVGFGVGVGAWLLFGRWVWRYAKDWHPVTRWLAAGLVSLAMAVLAQVGIIEPVAQWVHQNVIHRSAHVRH